MRPDECSEAVIGETGFEPATARPPAGCATRLRHSPWCSFDSTSIAPLSASAYGQGLVSLPPVRQAGDGNRTRAKTLEGSCATTTLRPRVRPSYRHTTPSGARNSARPLALPASERRLQSCRPAGPLWCPRALPGPRVAPPRNGRRLSALELVALVRTRNRGARVRLDAPAAGGGQLRARRTLSAVAGGSDHPPILDNGTLDAHISQDQDDPQDRPAPATSIRRAPLTRQARGVSKRSYRR